MSQVSKTDPTQVLVKWDGVIKRPECVDKVSCDWCRAEQSSLLIGPVPRLRVAGDLGLQAGQEDNCHGEEREERGDLHQGDGGALHQLQVFLDIYILFPPP